MVYEHYRGQTDERSEKKGRGYMGKNRSTELEGVHSWVLSLLFKKDTSKAPRLLLASSFPKPPPAVLMR